ncbi:hypothetical protein MRX96_051145 [Rhipicephalus microplus]
MRSDQYEGAGSVVNSACQAGDGRSIVAAARRNKRQGESGEEDASAGFTVPSAGTPARKLVMGERRRPSDGRRRWPPLDCDGFPRHRRRNSSGALVGSDAGACRLLVMRPLQRRVVERHARALHS